MATSDYDIIRLARRMQRLIDESADILNEIEASDHPNADEIASLLREEQAPVRTVVLGGIHPLLDAPERWAMDGRDLIRNHTDEH